MSHLRSFLTRPRVLPLNISNPITSSFISFHCLPTECKLYILNMLFHQTPVSYFVLILFSLTKDETICPLQKVLDTCTHLGNDSVGNKFYLAQDARVYAAMKNDPETNLSVTLIIWFFFWICLFPYNSDLRNTMERRFCTKHGAMWDAHSTHRHLYNFSIFSFISSSRRRCLDGS